MLTHSFLARVFNGDLSPLNLANHLRFKITDKQRELLQVFEQRDLHTIEVVDNAGGELSRAAAFAAAWRVLCDPTTNAVIVCATEELRQHLLGSIREALLQSSMAHVVRQPVRNRLTFGPDDMGGVIFARSLPQIVLEQLNDDTATVVIVGSCYTEDLAFSECCIAAEQKVRENNGLLVRIW